MKRMIKGLLAVCMVISVMLQATGIHAEENKLDGESIALYDSSYQSLKDRVTERGFAPTSVSGNGYLGMFVRDSSIQVMAHTAYGDTGLARKMLKFILSVHEELGLDRTGHVLNDFEDEAYGNNYLSGLETNRMQLNTERKQGGSYQKQENHEMPLFVVNGPANAGGTAFTAEDSTIEFVDVYLSKSSNQDKVTASIYEDIRNEETLLGKGEYVFGDNPNGWQKIVFQTPINVKPGQTYYLKIQAESSTGNVLWHGTATNLGDYLNGWNYDVNVHGGWIEVPYYPAFALNEEITENDGEKLPPFTAQTNAEMAVYNINAPLHRSAQPFVSDVEELQGFMIYLTKTYDTDTLSAWITTDVNDDSATIAETTYTFHENPDGWQYLLFDHPVKVEPGKKYYLVLQADDESGAVIWYGTAAAQDGYLPSKNDDNGQWIELPYYMTFQCIPPIGLNAPLELAQEFSVKGDHIDQIDIMIDAEKAGGNIIVDIREDYSDSSTSLGRTTAALSQEGKHTYRLQFEQAIPLESHTKYYAVISVEGNDSKVNWVNEPGAFDKESYVHDEGWKTIPLRFVMQVYPEISGDYRIPLINLNDVGSVMQEIPVTSERITGVQVMLGHENCDKGIVKATLLKGNGDDAQLIDTDEVNITDIDKEGWTIFLFGLPLTKTKEDGNYYLKLETEGCGQGSVIWYGTEILDHYDTLSIENGEESILPGELSYDALKSDIQLMSDYTQTDGNYMLIHAWAKYVANNKGTPEDIEFIKESYPIIRRFANSYLDGSEFNDEMNLIRNPNLEHSREGRMWNCYDLLTNVFMSQALHELSEIASDMEDVEMSEKWKAASETIARGINQSLICEVDGKKIYGELYDIDHDMKLIKGLSWVNLAPIAAEWYAIDMEIMQNTYDVFRKYGTTQVYGFEILTDKIDLDKPEPIPNFAGKQVAWEMMYNRAVNDEARLQDIVDMELATSKNMGIDVYPEAWWGEESVTDPGNQEHTSWQVYAMSILFSDLTKRPSTEELYKLIQQSLQMKEEEYTRETWAEFEHTLNHALDIIDDDHMNRQDIDEARFALLTSKSDLQRKGNTAALSALQNMVDKANALGSDDEALNTAIETAQALLNDPDNASVTAVVSALFDLSEAMQALNTNEGADALREDVQATIDFINENILNDVEGLRPGKVQALKDAVQAAQTLVNDPNATADELRAANKAMTKAAQELWEIATKAELEALIKAANGYLDGNYTAESLEALQAAIEAAQAIAINDDATTAEVTEAITNLSDAIAGLEAITLDTSALEHEIDLVNEMLANLDDYVPSSVEGLADKLADAQNVLDIATSQAEIDEAVKMLREARLNARTKADVSALEKVIAYAKSLDLSGYTTDSAQAVIQTLARAEQMINDPEITQEEVDDMVKELQVSVDELVEVNDSTNAEDPTNTSAVNTTNAVFALMIAAGAASIAAYRRKRS